MANFLNLTMLSIAGECKWFLYYLNIKTAFCKIVKGNATPIAFNEYDYSLIKEHHSIIYIW